MYPYTVRLLRLAFLLPLLWANTSRAQLNADFTANDRDGCAGYLTVNFTSTSTGSITTYAWDFGDGATSSQTNPSHTYSTAGVYTVKLTVSNGSTTDTEIKSGYITVFANPVAIISTSGDPVCEGSPITFTSSSTPGSGPITQCLWTYNDGSPSDTACPSITHIFSNGTSGVRTFYPNLLVSDANGCNSAANDTVFVFPRPVAQFSVGGNSGCNAPATISFTNNSQLTNSYTWNFGDPGSSNNTSTQTSPSHTYQNSGIYTVILVAGVAGCNSSDTQTVVLANPQAAFTASEMVICQGETVNFTNTGTQAGFNWNFGDPSSGANNTSVLEDPSHLYNNSGNYTVTLVVTANGCSDTATLSIRVKPKPTIAFGANDRAACDTSFTVQFADSTGGIVSWSWNFGDPTSGSQNTSTSQRPVHTYTAFGNYPVTLTVTDTAGCSNTLTLGNYIQIFKPTLDFTRPDSGCVGDVFSFNALVNSPADPTITNYQWNFGDGTGNQNFTTSSCTHTYTAPGIYDVTLTITTASGCTVTLTKPAYIRIGIPPNTNFTATPTVICFQDTVQFTDISVVPPVITAWQWSFGDGGGSLNQNPSHVYDIDTSGTLDPFNVTLITFNNGCADTLEITNMITVRGPKPDFSPVYNCANPLSVTFTNLTGGATDYLWDFGDNTTSTLATPTHVFPNRGDFTVVLTASNSLTGCDAFKARPVQIRIPDAVISIANDTGCAPLSANFIGSNSQDGNQYKWYFGDPLSGANDSSALSNPIHLYNNPGNYTATLTITDIHGCTNSETYPIRVNGPTAGFTGGPFTGCPPLMVNFADTSDVFGSNIVRWDWNFGNGNTSSSTVTGAAMTNYQTAGNYSVTLTVTDANGCSNSTTSTNYIRPTRPSPVISTTPGDTVACRNEYIGFSVNPGPYVAPPVTYAWTLGDGSTETASSFTHAYANNGSYTATVIATDANGCKDTTSIDLLVYTTPAQFSIQAIDTCVEQNGIRRAQVFVSITSDSNLYATQWSWDLELTTIPQGSASVFYAYSVPPDTYSVSLIITNQFGCRDTADDPGAVIVPGPTGSFTFEPDSGCRPLLVNFYGNSLNAATYSWDFGDGNVSIGTSDDTLSHWYVDNGVFLPQFYLGFQLPQSQSICYVPVDTAGLVHVNSLLGVNILEDSLVVTDQEYDTLHVTVVDPVGLSPYTYTWTPAQQVSPLNVNDGTFLVTTNGDTSYYLVTLPYGNGCSVVDSVLIIYRPCENALKIPNVFTPNDDGKNDTYFIEDLCQSADFRFVIYNRWGRIIYETGDPDFRWDGTTNSGELASEGVYYFTMKTLRNSRNGWIELIR